VCNKSPFFAFVLRLYLAYNGDWPDLACEIPELWAWGPKLWFHYDFESGLMVWWLPAPLKTQVQGWHFTQPSSKAHFEVKGCETLEKKELSIDIRIASN
jgi:hypothetical protein